MKKIICNIIAMFSVAFCTTCSGFTNQDSLKTIIRFQLHNEPLLKNIKFINVSNIYRDTLYLISHTSLIKINLRSKSISTDTRFNQFLISHSKNGNYASQIIVNNAGYFVSIGKKLYLFAKGFPKLILSSEREIYSFQILGNDQIILSSYEKIALANLNGKFLTEITDENLNTTNYFSYDNGLGYLSIKSIEFIKSINSKIQKASHNIDILIKEDINFFPSLASDSFFVGFSYNKRDRIYYIDLVSNERKIINLPNDYTPSPAELQKEEGLPNFKILYSDSALYAVALKKRVLDVVKIKIF